MLQGTTWPGGKPVRSAVGKLLRGVTSAAHSNSGVFVCKVVSGSSAAEKQPAKAGDVGLIPGSGRSPAEGSGYTLQYSCLEDHMHRRSWWATIHGVAQEPDMIQ